MRKAEFLNGEEQGLWFLRFVDGGQLGESTEMGEAKGRGDEQQGARGWGEKAFWVEHAGVGKVLSDSQWRCYVVKCVQVFGPRGLGLEM